MISVNFYIIFIVFYNILFCSAPLSSIVSGAIQIHFVIDCVTVIKFTLYSRNDVRLTGVANWH